MDKNILKEHNRLKHILKQQSKHYYTGNVKISDTAWDDMMDRLRVLEDKYTYLDVSDSPTRLIGTDSDEYTVSYDDTMYSMNKTKDTDDIFKLIDKSNNICNSKITSLVIEPKVDGMAIRLVYEDGILTEANTRGDGNNGKCIIHHVKSSMTCIPNSIELDGIVILKGELYIPKDKKSIYGNNLRNVVAGAINSNEATIDMSDIKLLIYDTSIDVNNSYIDSIIESVLWTDIPAVPHMSLHVCEDTTDKYTSSLLVDTLDRYRKYCQYEIDGLVIKLNNLWLREQLGYTKRYPRWCIAYKPTIEEEVSSRVISIENDIGLSGKITYVAHITPIVINGATISKVAIGSYKTLKENDIRIRSKVNVIRSGMIIPKIVSVCNKDNKNKPYSIDKCPICGSDITALCTDVYCNNKKCIGIIRRKMIETLSKRGLDIPNHGPKFVDEYIKNNEVEYYTDILDANSVASYIRNNKDKIKLHNLYRVLTGFEFTFDEIAKAEVEDRLYKLPKYIPALISLNKLGYNLI